MRLLHSSSDLSYRRLGKATRTETPSVHLRMFHRWVTSRSRRSDSLASISSGFSRTESASRPLSRAFVFECEDLGMGAFERGFLDEPLLTIGTPLENLANTQVGKKAAGDAVDAKLMYQCCNQAGG